MFVLIAAALFCFGAASARPGLSCRAPLDIGLRKLNFVSYSGTLEGTSKPDVAMGDLDCQYNGTRDTIEMNPMTTTGFWYRHGGNDEFFTVQSCSGNSDYPVQVYIFESDGHASSMCAFNRFNGQCLLTSVEHGNCWIDPRQACAQVRARKGFDYYVFVTTADSQAQFGNYEVTFESHPEPGRCDSEIAPNSQCQADLNADLASSNMKDLLGQQEVCLENAKNNTSGEVASPEEIDCRGTSEEIEQFKEDCLGIKEHSGYQLCDYTESVEVNDGASISVQLHECMPKTCTDDFRRRVAAHFGTSISCTSSGLSVAEIAGIAAGCVALVLIIAGGVWWTKRPRSQDSPDSYKRLP